MRDQVAGGDVYYGWVVVSACFAGSMVVFGLSYSFGVFFEPLLADFDGARSDVSLVFSLHSFMLYIGAVVIGRFVDVYGTRRMMVVGTLLLGSGLLWSSRANSWLELVFAYGVVVSLGLSVIYVVSYATVPRWFEQNRGLASGLASAGLGIGMVLVAPAAELLIEFFDWRVAYMVFAAALSGLALLITVFIADDPAALGVDHEDRSTSARDQVTNGTGKDIGIDAVFTLLRTRSFQFVFLGWVCIYATLFVVFVNLPVFATDADLSRRIGAVTLAVIGGTSVGSRLAIGYLADRIGRVRIFVVCSLIMGGATLLLPAATTTSALVLFGIVYGLGYGGNGALLGPLIADLFGASGLNTAFGLMSTSFALSGLFFPYLAGVTYDTIGTYTPIFVACGLLGVGGAGLVATGGRLEGQLVP